MNTRFTIEEENIVAIYAEDSRETTLENILAAMPYMDEDMRQLAAAAVNKLQAMTDSEFSEREFILTDDPVIHAVCPRIKPTGNIYNRTVGIFGNKIPNQLVKYNASCNNSSAHSRIFFCIAEIIIYFSHKFFGFCVVKFIFWIFTVHCPCIKTLQHCLCCSVKHRFYFFLIIHNYHSLLSLRLSTISTFSAFLLTITSEIT